ncbi:FAD-binding oxidoreductase [Thiolinea disciformis]|uniref:FAD-binding oxidoreductase n=1 Tax=Thiolinea disciformis TaxID=125614 RepID=UPI00036CF552|nr:FAD-binding oxidoreductase [Thiolinea disciformis]
MNPEILGRLHNLLGDQGLRTDPLSCQTYGRDWTKTYEPAPSAIALPTSTAQVQAIIQLANQNGFKLVPSGGRTGLSGGAVAAQGELVVSLARMNKILAFHAQDRSLVCEAGVITAQLQQFAETKGLFYPVDFASAGSSQIGGNIATNAGGIKVIRYGLTRQQVLGLEIVTGKGELLKLNHGLVKNATGYDLRHLFIGSEGTLGIITQATLQLLRAPENLTVLVLGVPEFAALMQILQRFQANLDLTAFEFFSDRALHYVVQDKGLAKPFVTPAPYYALLEFENDSAQREQAALQAFQDCIEQGFVLDGVMSQSQTQAKNLWRLREMISETIAVYTPYKNDLSVRVSLVAEFLKAVDQIVTERYAAFEVIWYGHIGDGNLHLNILKPATMDKAEFFEHCAAVNEQVFVLTQSLQGSISAEHGVGLLKRDYLAYSRSAEEIAYMRALKTLFDPHWVLNPNKLLSIDTSSL